MKKLICLVIAVLVAASPMITRLFAEDVAMSTMPAKEQTGFMHKIKMGVMKVFSAIAQAVRWVINGIQHIFHSTVNFVKGLFGGNKSAAPMPAQEMAPAETMMMDTGEAMQ